MKRQCVCLFLIHFLLLFSVTASMATVEVVSILGYVEIRRQGHNYWEVAKKGMELSDEDLVRIPPKATLRVRLESGDAVYFVPGQEKLAKDLVPSEKRRIVDGRTRSSKATDMLASSTLHFAERSRHGERQTGNSASLSLMANQQVDFLLSTLAEDANNEAVRDFAQSVVGDIPITMDTGYPSRNIACAQHLLNMLRAKIKSSNNDQPPVNQNIQPLSTWFTPVNPSSTLETRQGNDLDIARLYLALLNAAGVEAKPCGDNNVLLFIVFNSGIPAGEAQSITVNKKLYLVENDTVWFPIQITPSTWFTSVNPPYPPLGKGGTSSDNFIKAWYKGSEVYLKYENGI